MYPLIRPILFKTDPEWIHDIALWGLSKTPMANLLALGRSTPGQPVTLWNIRFPNRLGLAAGFDKDAAALRAWEQLGFGFIEAGTVTPLPQPGNPKKRVFRLPQQKAIINRMGFPNHGLDAMVETMKRYRQKHPDSKFPVGLNIGKGKETPLDNAPADYLACFEKLKTLGDFFVVNVSSPNTPDLRKLQDPRYLQSIFQTLQDRNDLGKPILVKIAPDLTNEQIAPILQTVTECKLAGIVATNTTIDHTGMPIEETGGLSGEPLKKKSTEIIRFIHQETEGKLPIIGVGGVFTKDDYQEKLDAGASLVQVYTGFVYQGPWIAHQILK